MRALEKNRGKQRQSCKNRPWKHSEDKEEGEPLMIKTGCGRGETRRCCQGWEKRWGKREKERRDSRGNRGLNGGGACERDREGERQTWRQTP